MVINHKEFGLLIKEIIKQKGPILTCHSWNRNVKDFDVNLGEINQLFYMKEIRKKF
jgi:hypothetical protein